MHKLRVVALLALVVGMVGCFSNAGVTLSNYAAGAPSAVTFSYTLSEPLTTADYLLIGTLPSEFTVAFGTGQAFCSANIAISINGSPRPFPTSGDTCFTSGTTVQIILGPASLPAGTAVSVSLSSAIVTNPAAPRTYTMSNNFPNLSFYTANPNGFVIEAASGNIDLTITPPTAASPAPALSTWALAALALLLAALGSAMTRLGMAV